MTAELHLIEYFLHDQGVEVQYISLSDVGKIIGTAYDSAGNIRNLHSAIANDRLTIDTAGSGTSDKVHDKSTAAKSEPQSGSSNDSNSSFLDDLDFGDIELFNAESIRLVDAENERLKKQATPQKHFDKLPEQLNAELDQYAESVRKFQQNNQEILNEIKDIVVSRKIKCLVHFTDEYNAGSIRKFGFLTREQLDKYVSGQYHYHDQSRSDKARWSISVSVDYPNTRMLYFQQHRDIEGSTVVFFLDPAILYTLPCTFCYTNAANDAFQWDIRKDQFVKLEEISTFKLGKQHVDDFRKMFYETTDNHRQSSLLSDSMPTDIQAEVLVNADIPKEYILSELTIPNDKTAAADPYALDHYIAKTYGLKRDDQYNYWNTHKAGLLESRDGSGKQKISVKEIKSY